MKKLTLLSVSLFISIIIFAQCKTGDCINGHGIYIYSNGDQVEGDFKEGKLNGKCKIIFSSGAIYDGEMINGLKNGLGKYSFKNGNYYDGIWKDDKKNGKGKYVQVNGYKEEGVYSNDSLNGKANIEYSSGNKYEGSVSNSIPFGKGIMNYKNGMRFEGVFKNGLPDGQGEMFYPMGGGKKIGRWVNGEFIDGLKKENDLDAYYVIPLKENNGGTYSIAVELNNSYKIDFVFDPGAAEVLFTATTLLSLINNNTFSNDDFIGEGRFIDASGNLNKLARFKLRSLKIGNIELKDVTCAVAPPNAEMNLLGISALSKLNAFEIDFANQVLKVKK